MSDIEFDSRSFLKDLMNSRDVRDGMEQRVARVVADAEGMTPVKTGEMHRDWYLTETTTTDPTLGTTVPSFVIGNSSEHSEFVEFGTRFMPAENILLRAVQENDIEWSDHVDEVQTGGPRRGSRNRDRRRR